MDGRLATSACAAGPTLTPLRFYPVAAGGPARARARARRRSSSAGGNTANMLAVWRVHGFDAILREAWEARRRCSRGWSAGMICWFEAGVTDSFGPQLEGMRDGLGFLPGSACPHYDGEELRRPVYKRLVRDGLPGRASRSTTQPARTTSGRSCARSSRRRARVRAATASAPDGETPLTARLLL